MNSKKILLSILISMLCFTNVMAAVVSDSDGIAFVTKGEFDKLKDSFASQIDSYNNSIDKKIDGAIAQYLAGLKVDMTGVNLWEKVQKETAGKFRVLSDVPYVGSGTTTTQYDVKVTRRYRTKLYKDFQYLIGARVWGASIGTTALRNKVSLEFCVKGKDYSGGGADLADDANCLLKGGLLKVSANGSITGSTSMEVNNASGTASGSKRTATEVAICPTGFNDDNLGLLGTEYVNNVQTFTNSVSGSGNLWETDVSTTGKKYLRFYNTSYIPMHSLELIVHDYKDMCTDATQQTEFLQFYCNKTGKSLLDADTSTSETFTEPTNIGVTTVGIDNPNYDDDVVYKYQNITAAKVNDGVSYDCFQWGNNTTKSVYNYDLMPETLEFDSSYTTESTTGYTFISNFISCLQDNTQENTMPDLDANFKVYKVTPNYTQIHDFICQPLTNIFGENVYVGGGVPLYTVSPNLDNGTLRMEVEFEAYDNAGNVVSDNIPYIVSDKQFIDGAVDTANGGKNLASGTWTSGVSTIDVSVESKDNVFINFYPSSAYSATIKSIKFEVL